MEEDPILPPAAAAAVIPEHAVSLPLQQQQQQQQQQQPAHNTMEEDPTIHPAASAAVIPEHAASLPLQQQQPAPNLIDITAVDGQGMWRAWTRVFQQPESACLDLLDNCFDATLHDGFHGKVVMNPLEENETGITITNNSFHPIKELDEALTVYKSSKNVATNTSSRAAAAGRIGDDNEDVQDATLRKDAIGENGVGLKHGCATLSDTSFVMTRNQDLVEVGVIAKALQSHRGVYLPSFAFRVKNSTDLGEIILHVEQLANERVMYILGKALGRGDQELGMLKLAQHIQTLFEGIFGNDDHVFHLVICDLHHSKKVVIDVDAEGPPLIASKVFLQEIEAMLPEYYINIPSEGFDFFIDGKRTHFTYWQRRLVELTEFQVNIPKDKPIEKLPDSSWCDEGYNLKIYCGFDAQRLLREKESTVSMTSCKLYIYTRQAGRLIEVNDDARYLLNLGASGSDFMQGLTVIVADIESELPLMPTKDGIAWSEQKGGAIHKSNFYAWTGAVAGCYWGQHFKQVGSLGKTNATKELLVRIIKSLANHHHDHIEGSNQMTNIVNGHFSTFEGVKWRKRTAKNTNKLVIFRAPQRFGFVLDAGEDTLFRITPDVIKEVSAEMTPNKRKTGRVNQQPGEDPAPTRSKKEKRTNHDSCDDSGADAVPDGAVSQGDRKRAKSSVNYCEVLSSNDETDEDDLVFYTPSTKRSARKKKAKPDDNNLEEKLLEKENQLKEQTLKAQKAEREAQESKKRAQEGEKLVQNLLSELQRYKNRKPPPASASPRDLADLQEQLRKMTKQRDAYKRKMEELEQLAATTTRGPKNRQVHLPRRSDGLDDSSSESESGSEG